MDVLAHLGDRLPVRKQLSADTAHAGVAVDPRLPVVEPVESPTPLEGGVCCVVVAAGVVEFHLLGRVADPSGVETPGSPVDRGAGAVDREAVLTGRQAVTRNGLGAPLRAPRGACRGGSCQAERGSDAEEHGHDQCGRTVVLAGHTSSELLTSTMRSA